MRDRIKGVWIKAVLASMALPTSLAHGTQGGDADVGSALGARSLEDSMDWAALPGNTNTPVENFWMGALSPLG